MRPMNVSLATLTVTLGLVACGGSTPQTAPASGSTPPSSSPRRPANPTSSAQRDPQALHKEAQRRPDMPPPGASVERVMRAHFQDALLIRQAVIAGAPEQAANPATVLALIENLDDLPPGWRELVERMQHDARRITNSTSAAQAAAATADLGLACGLCHQKLGGPKLVNELPPVAPATIEGRMKLHEWASERLWEGLVVPSSEAWETGARALSDDPFPPAVLKRGGVHARSAASDFSKLIAKASSARTGDERAALYAELLVTCGTCHRAIREATIGLALHRAEMAVR